MTTHLHLIRHAHAGSRSEWTEDDELRPLSDRGLRQAAAIATALTGAGIDLLLTSRYVRCRQTLEPLAAALGLPVADDALLAEGGWGNDALDALLSAVGEGRTVAACSHGDVIPAIVATAVRRGAELVGPSAPKKGARYECEVRDGQIVRLVAVPPPDRYA
jgi:broad specificity phosphatase PhoE